MKKHTILLTALAAALILAATVAPAMAYFTAHKTVRGSITIHMAPETRLQEKITGLDKHVTVTNTGSALAYVRVKVFSVAAYTGAGTGWSREDDGYYYYREALAPGGETNELLVEVTPPEEGDSFNVIVVYESVPALYDGNGDPYADWNQEITVIDQEGGRAA